MVRYRHSLGLVCLALTLAIVSGTSFAQNNYKRIPPLPSKEASEKGRQMAKVVKGEASYDQKLAMDWYVKSQLANLTQDKVDGRSFYTARTNITKDLSVAGSRAPATHP